MTSMPLERAACFLRPQMKFAMYLAALGEKVRVASEAQIVARSEELTQLFCVVEAPMPSPHEVSSSREAEIVGASTLSDERLGFLRALPQENWEMMWPPESWGRRRRDQFAYDPERNALYHFGRNWEEVLAESTGGWEPPAFGRS